MATQLKDPKVVLKQLTDFELAALKNVLDWEQENPRKVCERQPWFPKVAEFFTREEGKQLHKSMREAIDRAVARRLRG